MIHEMNLQDRYFDYIKSGTKRIELRLFDEKRQKINIGDIITFTNSRNEKLPARVIGLLRYSSFEELFKDFDISILADSSMLKTKLLGVLEEFYTKEKQSRYGVVGIRIELV